MGEPNPAVLCQPGIGPMLQRMFLATRPGFLSASIIPVLAGSAWGFSQSGIFEFYPFVLAIFATALAHGGINVLNDVYDDKNGSDPANTERVFPFTGGSRFIQNEIFTNNEMARLGWVLIILALVMGLWLSTLYGWPIIAMGGFGILLGVAYSAPPLFLAARGLGEAAVGIGFGPLPVLGAAWLQGAKPDFSGLIFASIIGLWVGLILLINEVPDINADGKAGKRTLVVRLGHKKTAVLYMGLHLIAIALIAYLVSTKILPTMALGILVLLPVALNASRVIYSQSNVREKMTGAIKSTLAIHGLGSLWIAIIANT